jgi:hypothetical protein
LRNRKINKNMRANSLVFIAIKLLDLRIAFLTN